LKAVLVKKDQGGTTTSNLQLINHLKYYFEVKQFSILKNKANSASRVNKSAIKNKISFKKYLFIILTADEVKIKIPSNKARRLKRISRWLHHKSKVQIWNNFEVRKASGNITKGRRQRHSHRRPCQPRQKLQQGK
jgi:hypothetical protein